MTSRDVTCPLCGALDLRLAADRLRGGAPARIVECAGCGLVFQEPRERADVYAFYRHDFPGNYQYRDEINQRRYDLLGPLLDGQREVLEIGCSSGEFLALIRPKARSVAGVELVPHDVDTARAKHGLTIHDRPIEDLDLESAFDLVLAFQTFEHIPAPNEFLGCVRRLLRPGGRLVLEVPNVNEPLLALYRLDAFRSFYFVPQHLFYYSQDTLPRMLRKNGFVPEAVRLVQMGSLTNHLHWMRERGPQRDLAEVCSVVLPEDVASAEVRELFEELNRHYVSALVARGYSDTLWVEAGVARAA